MPRRYRSLKSGARKPSSWRRFQSRFKFKKRLRRLTLVITVVAAVILTLGAYNFLKLFFSPLDSAAGASFQNTSSWDGRMPLSILFLEVSDLEASSSPTQSVGVFSLNPTQGLFTILNLPTSHRNLRDLYGLGEINARSGGVGVLADEVRGILGVPVDGYVIVSREGLQELRQLFSQARSLKDFFALENFLKIPEVWTIVRDSSKTSLDIPSILRVAWYLARIRSDMVDQFALAPELLDNSASLDRKLSPYFRDDYLVEEHLKIQVLNGSGRSGLAVAAARVIRNIGGEVIRVDNFGRQDLVKGYLLLESSGSYTAARLARIFGVSDSRPPREGSEARANITVVLGSENSFEVD
ncbi:MAG: LCP family protein [candidate division WWE3 bacterium]|nr:LCP family protein [candidate division WWE3 bacterium]